MQKTRVQSLSWEDPLGKEWQPTPVLLPEESHGQREEPQRCKESDTAKRAHTCHTIKNHLREYILMFAYILFP